MNRYEISWEGIAEPDWAVHLPDFLNRICVYIGVDSWEVSLTFCDNDHIRDLNARYRNKAEATDVLSFPQYDGTENFPDIPGIGQHKDEDFFFAVGDIVISPAFVLENSQYFGVPYEEELKRVIIHGMLHLKGLDHQTSEPDEPMLLFQEEILESTKDVRLFS